MKFRFFTLAGLCALCLALVLIAVPAVAQTATDNANRPAATDHSNMSSNSSQSNSAANAGNMSDDQIVPGTGVTLAELKTLGYTPDQIASIQSDQGTMSAQNQPSGSADQNAANSSNNPNNPDQKASTNAAVGNGSSGGGWGLWGLVGLLGLLGLGGRGRRAETVRDERDIRRVA